MGNYLPVKDHPGLVRDPVSGAILNTDNAALAAYKARKKQAVAIAAQTEEIANLKADVAEIKDLLRQLLGKA
jgi:L-serine deaminase